MRDPFPLQWPTGWPRTRSEDREHATFRVTLAEAVAELEVELDRLDAANVVITSDLPTRADGRPYSSARCEDSGIAVWFVHQGTERVFACDRWSTPAANMRAIGLSIEALRGLQRWGAADLVMRAFSGFAALPAGDGTEQAAVPPDERWRDVLGLHDLKNSVVARDPLGAMARVRVRHRELVKRHHTDVGGAHDDIAAINAARDAAEAAITRLANGVRS